MFKYAKKSFSFEKTFNMIILNIDRTNALPIYKQVMDGIKSLIAAQTLRVGDKVPSSRKLADQLGVNRTTVMRAYEELWAEGYIESRSGSYSTVRERRSLSTNTGSLSRESIQWNKRLTSESKTIRDAYQTKDVYDQTDLISFLDLSPDNRIMPVEPFKRVINSVFREKTFIGLQYGKPQGYEGLRETICKQMQKHSIAIRADEIIIVDGAQNGLDLVCRALVKPGDTIIVEEPGYSMAHPLFAYCGAKVIGVPMTETGVSIELLEEKIKESKPVFVYTMPNFHNPTGITTTQEHREKLIALCESYSVPIVEDGFEEEMKYFGKAVLPLKSMDKIGLVIYVGTFSKVLFPGLRLAWVASNTELTKVLTAIKGTVSLSGNYLAQVAVDEFIRQGYYESHLRRLHKTYRKRMHKALSTIEKLDFGEKIKFTNPNGGYLVYGELREGIITENQLVEAALSNGVAITPGSKFYYREKNKTCFRLSIAHLDENQIGKGLHRLKQAIDSL